ncbi:hypothetical protein B0T25DRAFT_20285 [Lasiosphaeria hispida]|uniref:Uncharacterized protein n=1 Tax=Lasiosphaeria hispida TaxID=260671 RepID=A0AAJ0HU63_9PEZI|nr:hypothetical protein B0T25DRAFT_20285 [Lasiosphaeria hispida]
MCPYCCRIGSRVKQTDCVFLLRGKKRQARRVSPLQSSGTETARPRTKPQNSNPSLASRPPITHHSFARFCPSRPSWLCLLLCSLQAPCSTCTPGHAASPPLLLQSTSTIAVRIHILLKAHSRPRPELLRDTLVTSSSPALSLSNRRVVDDEELLTELCLHT